jgi:WD40 repeat protein
MAAHGLSENHERGLPAGVQYARAVTWSQDERPVFFGARDGTVRLWDVDTGRCLRVLEGHPVGVVTVAWGWMNGEPIHATERRDQRLGHCLSTFCRSAG